MWCISGCSGRDDVCVAGTLSKYDLITADLFVLSWARVRRVRRESISSELLMLSYITLW